MNLINALITFTINHIIMIVFNPMDLANISKKYNQKGDSISSIKIVFKILSFLNFYLIKIYYTINRSNTI
jgi:hypothetical protein